MSGHSFTGGWFEITLAGLALLALLGYWGAAVGQWAGGRRWSGWCAAAFTLGVALVLIALLPSVVNWAHHDLRGHMVQHLLLGMVAPLGLVLGAPVSLSLRSCPKPFGRALLRLLRSAPLRLLSHPVTALLLNVGGMYLLYLTPLHQAMHANYSLHAWVHWHFLAAGCLFTWAIAGPDPAPRRPGHGYRLLVVAVSMAAHAILAKAMYAYGWPRGGTSSLAEIQSAAKIMYYGGDLAELVLVVVLFNDWFNRRGKRRLKSAGTPCKRSTAGFADGFAR